MSAPSPAFADSFQEHLSPRLARLCVAQARCVAAGVETFDRAYDAVLRYARRYGALLLLPPDLQELEDWIAVTLSAAIFEAEAEGYDRWLVNNHISGGRVP